MRFIYTLLTAILITSFSSQAAEKPNILFVLFDDMGYGEPTSYRPASLFKTPNIDRMAKEGIRFTDAHSSAANCTPTRYGFLTGRYPHRIGQFGVLSTFSPPLIPKTRLTVASYLKQNGYATACIGKWHLGMNWKKQKPKGKLRQNESCFRSQPIWLQTQKENIWAICSCSKTQNLILLMG